MEKPNPQPPAPGIAARPLLLVPPHPLPVGGSRVFPGEPYTPRTDAWSPCRCAAVSLTLLGEAHRREGGRTREDLRDCTLLGEHREQGAGPGLGPPGWVSLAGGHLKPLPLPWWALLGEGQQPGQGWAALQPQP